MIESILAMIFILLIIFGIWKLLAPEYDKCYTKMEYRGYAAMNCCGGLVGGTSATEYLSETCVDCPYLVLGCDRKEKKND